MACKHGPSAHLPNLAMQFGLGKTISASLASFKAVPQTFCYWTLALENGNPIDEMMPEDRIRNQLRHFPTLLKRWAGGTARVLELTTSHATLTIRIEHPKKDGNLQIAISPPLHFRGPFLWPDCEIDISLNDDRHFIIRDTASDVEILTEHILGVCENAKPHYRMVVPREN